MRKMLSLVVALCVLMSLAGCAATPIEKCQQKAVSIGEAFLNFEITKSEAIEQLDSLMVPETEGNGQLYLSGDIKMLAWDIRTNATYADIAEKVESIRNEKYE